MSSACSRWRANCKPENSNDNAALVVGDFSGQYIPPPDLITHSVIAHSAGHAIDAMWTGGGYGPNLSAAANGNSFTDDAGCAQTLNGLEHSACLRNGCQE